MPGYAGQIKTRDRWAIVAYVRALQLSQNASIEQFKNLDDSERAKILKEQIEAKKALKDKADAAAKAAKEKAQADEKAVLEEADAQEADAREADVQEADVQEADTAKAST